MEFRRIFDRDARDRHPVTTRKVDHGGRAVIGTSVIKGRPPSGSLAIHGPRTIDRDVAQTGTINKTCVLRKCAHSGHSQNRTGGQLERHIAFKGNRAAEEGSRGNHDRSAAPHRVDGGLNGGCVVGATGGGVIGG